MLRIGWGLLDIRVILLVEGGLLGIRVVLRVERGLLQVRIVLLDVRVVLYLGLWDGVGYGVERGYAL